MKIIGHRGVAGSELENTLASLQTAKDIGVDAVEFDVRKTKDGKLVVCHDADLSRVADDKRRIDELTLNQLQKIPLATGSHVPSLDEAMDVIGAFPCIIELKDSGCTAELVKILSRHPKARFSVASFKLGELASLKAVAPDYKLFALENTKPFDVIHLAKELDLDGIGFNYWILNPLSYFLCRRAGLEIYAYTVDNRFQVNFLKTFYPELNICTNYPERLLEARVKAKRSSG
jgi:glycerophosphoryl diester phosphodiesterase